MAANTDKFKKLTNNFSTTLSGSIVGSGDSSMSLASTTNLPTDTGTVYVIDRVNSSGVATPSLREYVIGTASGSNVTNLLRGVGNSTAQAHSTGAVVEQVVDQRTINDIIDGILQDHDQQGRAKQLTDTNGNMILGLTPTASAVNQFTITDAATGNDPIQQSTGSDSNIGQVNQTKGLGNWRVKGRADGWNDLSGFGTFIYNANNGQKEFVVTTPSDLSSFLSVGQRIRFDRGTVPPTQSMAFTAASSQYATKASPAGITFTGAFTCEAWVYLNSYTGLENNIINRRNSTFNGGWGFVLNSSGQVQIFYGTGANSTNFTSYQSIPLKRWVHVAGVVTSVASKTGAIYINGVSVQVSSTATAATTLTQAAEDLRVGAVAGGTLASTYFDGFMSEVRVWSTNQTQANIQANMAINLTGAEANLVALFKGNGNFTDTTSNANTLTANGGAIATQAANPYNSTEYGIITKVTSTQLTIFTGTDYTIPNMTLNNPYYSTARAPQGFPSSTDKWFVDSQILTNGPTTTLTVNGTWVATPQTLPVPTGAWKLSYIGSINAATTVAASRSQLYTLASSAPTNSVYNQVLTSRNYINASSSNAIATVGRNDFANLSAQTTYTLYAVSDAISGVETAIHRGDQGPVIIRAESAYI